MQVFYLDLGSSLLENHISYFYPSLCLVFFKNLSHILLLKLYAVNNFEICLLYDITKEKITCHTDNGKGDSKCSHLAGEYLLKSTQRSLVSWRRNKGNDFTPILPVCALRVGGCYEFNFAILPRV